MGPPLRLYWLLLVAVVSQLILIGCGGSSAQQCTGCLGVIAPGNQAQASSLPLEIKVAFPGGQGQNGFRATLNGVDVTRRFGPLRNGVRRGRFHNRHLLLGSNTFTASNNSGSTPTYFTFSPPGLPGTTNSEPNYIPIVTQVVQGDGTQISDYGVQVGTNTYFAASSTFANLPVTNGVGFQFLLLDRTHLNVVSNSSFSTADTTARELFSDFISNPASYSGCPEFGCILVIQSFSSVGAAAYNDPSNTLATTLHAVGGSGRLGYVNFAATASYSLITSVTSSGSSSPGTGQENILCTSNGTNCGRAAVSGILISDSASGGYIYASASRVPFATGTSPNSTSNAFTVGTTTYTASSVSADQGGIQLVILDRDNLSLIANRTYTPISCVSPNDSQCSAVSQQLALLDSDIRQYTQVYCQPAGDNCPLFLLSSIGNVHVPQNGNGTDGTADLALEWWYDVAADLRNFIGGTYSVFVQLQSGDDYALVGSSDPINPFPSVEASSVISRVIEPPGLTTPASNIRGIMKLDHSSGYAPFLSNLAFDFTQNTDTLLDSIALEAPVPWPYPQDGHPGQQAALAYFSQLTCKCPNIRASYTNLNAPLSGYQNIVGSATYPSNAGFSQQDFSLLQTQLTTELVAAEAIVDFESNLNQLYTAQNSNVGLLLTNDYGTVSNGLYHPPPPPNNNTAFDVLSITGDVMDLGSFLPGVGVAFGVGAVGLDIGATLVNLPSGSPALTQGGLLLDTYANLAADAANHFADSEEVLGTLFELILSDWGRMQQLATPIQQNQLTWDLSTQGAILGNFDRATRKQYLISLMAGVFTVEHDSPVAKNAPPTSFMPLCQGFPFYSYTVDNLVTVAVPSNPTGELPFTGIDGQIYDGYVLFNVPNCPFEGAGGVNRQTVQGLFSPLSLDDPSQLGEYAPRFYVDQRQIPVFTPPLTSQ